MRLHKDLVVLDLETTGTWIEKDRIIEIGLVKMSASGGKVSYVRRVNPGIPIPAIVTRLTGISDQDVREALPFRRIAAEVVEFLEGADLGGFNIERFDLPLLERELFEAGLRFEWRGRQIYDAQKIYHLHERRDLTAAYRFYCGKDLTQAHTALADAEATYDILKAQLAKYCHATDAIEGLADFEYDTSLDFYDQERRFRWWNGELYFMFGKYARKQNLREVASKDTAYLKWMLEGDFSSQVKDLVRAALEGRFPKAPSHDLRPAQS